MGNIEIRGILQDAYVIEVWEEGGIDIDYDKLPAPDIFPVSVQQATTQIIFEDFFVRGGLLYRSMWQCVRIIILFEGLSL